VVKEETYICGHILLKKATAAFTKTPEQLQQTM
jgi:hypothetical protein